MKKIRKVKKLLEMYIFHYWLFFIIVKKRNAFLRFAFVWNNKTVAFIFLISFLVLSLFSTIFFVVLNIKPRISLLSQLFWSFAFVQRRTREERNYILFSLTCDMLSENRATKTVNELFLGACANNNLALAWRELESLALFLCRNNRKNQL